MEHYLNFSQSQFNHSFVRWVKDGSRSKKEGKAADKIFNPAALDDDCMDKDLMLTAFSA
ncbi:MAG: hypothetical protein KKB51_02480 [Candidatus Riflebacteria bacterium]|nr:hypothetical protein [Candidatus Riflebacteria bacterium]